MALYGPDLSANKLPSLIIMPRVLDRLLAGVPGLFRSRVCPRGKGPLLEESESTQD